MKVEITHFAPKLGLEFKEKSLDLSTPKVMAILNATPDSFYAASRFDSESKIMGQIEKFINDGADLIDIGGVSSRPGSKTIDASKEADRILTSVERIVNEFPEALVSIDTFRSSVAKEALELGAFMINDISGGTFDPHMIDLIASQNVPYVAMHLQGSMETMHQAYEYEDITQSVIDFFFVRLKQLKDKGASQVIIDPGFGFSKNIEQNYELLENLERLNELNQPILVGLSRKSMIYKKLGITPEESLHGTIALNAITLKKGAALLRVHDVKEAKQLIDLVS